MSIYCWYWCSYSITITETILWTLLLSSPCSTTDNQILICLFVFLPISLQFNPVSWIHDTGIDKPQHGKCRIGQHMLLSCIWVHLVLQRRPVWEGVCCDLWFMTTCNLFGAPVLPGYCLGQDTPNLLLHTVWWLHFTKCIAISQVHGMYWPPELGQLSYFYCMNHLNMVISELLLPQPLWILQTY